MIKRVIYKIIRECWLLLHPHLWGHNIQINGIPSIENIKRLKIGDYVSLNSNCYIQCVGGGNYWQLCNCELWYDTIDLRSEYSRLS